jgi:hypothetical protein
MCALCNKKMKRTFVKAVRKKQQPQTAAPDLDAIWSQITPPKKEQTRLDRLLAAYTLAKEQCDLTIAAPLQHKCTQEACNWLKHGDDWYICKASGNLHVCTPQECKFRSDIHGVRVPVLHLNKGDADSAWLHQPERHSVCTLTGLVCEAVDFVDEEAWRQDQPRTGLHSKAVDAKLDKGAQQHDAALTFARNFYGAECKHCINVVHICCRLWRALLNSTGKPVCNFREYCLVVFKDLYQGWNVKTGADEYLWIIPKATFEMPDKMRLNDREFYYQVKNAKLVHTAIIGLALDVLRELHREFATLSWV